MNYEAPAWLPGGNLQTIWPALYGQRVFGPHPQYRRERWDTPDGDFVDVDFLATAPALPGVVRPLLVLFHGLEGSSRSHYAEAFADVAHAQGWDYAVPHFRGCSGEINVGPRAYHSGDFEEIGWVLRRLRAGHAAGAPLVVVGVSLGGNALLRWAEEAGGTAATTVASVAAVSSPIDLAAGGWAIGRGFNRQVYTRMFLRSMKPKPWPNWRSSPACSTARRCWRRVTCTRSTTSSPHPYTASKAQKTTGAVRRPSRTCTRSRFRRWW